MMIRSITKTNDPYFGRRVYARYVPLYVILLRQNPDDCIIYNPHAAECGYYRADFINWSTVENPSLSAWLIALRYVTKPSIQENTHAS